MATQSANVHDTRFRNGDTVIAAQLHLPPGFDACRRWSALVLSTPGRHIQPTMDARYASKLAARGFVVIAFDCLHRDANGDATRAAATSAWRADDLHCAVDHLVSLPFVDARQIGVLGICAGGGPAARAALTDPRVKALATVAGTDAGGTFRRLLARRRRHEARPQLRGIAPVRDGSPLQDLPDRLLQPLMVIVGSRHGGTRQHETGRALYGLARGRDQALVVIPDADPDGLARRDEHIDPAINRLAPFFHFHLEP
ncbi:alpha/beta hydrolase [Luteimonas aestuarii]|uniref:Alpha/beta hydrolase n=1 Tax=Luteimonas aestuarii TaxID=453837 RepID=A0A4R5TME8_9GAMM|nr:dienelactone hydrolase family protein [Luteimonas aestuarii]TDK23769.1 alpha/beta hydrolase [Luteimonas aestuarii]